MSMVEAQIWVWVLGPIWTEEAGAGLRHYWDARTPALSVGGVAISALCVLKFCYRRPEYHLCWPFTKDGTSVLAPYKTRFR